MDIESQAKKTDQVVTLIVTTLIRKDYKTSKYDYVLIRDGINRLRTLYPYDFASDRIIDFVVYQFYRYRTIIAEPGSRWHISWCFSVNAVKKFKAQFIDEDGKHGVNYYIDRWLNDGGLNRDMLTGMLADLSEHKLSKYIYMPSEELTKRRFHNTECGFMLCVGNTTGWSPESSSCKECGYVSRCMDHTKTAYPELFRIRVLKQKNENL